VGARTAEGWTRSTSCSCECTERGCSRRGRASSWATGGPKGSPEAHQGSSGAHVSPKRRVLEGQVACLAPLLLSQQLQNCLSWDKIKRSQYGDFNPCFLFLFNLQFGLVCLYLTGVDWSDSHLNAVVALFGRLLLYLLGRLVLEGRRGLLEHRGLVAALEQGGDQAR